MKFGLDGVQNSTKTVLSAYCGECDIYRNLQKEFNNNNNNKKIKLIVILEYLNTFKSNVLLKMLVL